MLRGIDVSDWQPGIDWPAVVAAGYRFAVIKATEGTGNVQSTFAGNRDAAAAAGVDPLGLYHFARPENGNPEAQANHFADVVGPLRAGEFIVLDVESGATSNWPGFMTAWFDWAEQRLGPAARCVYMSESPARSMPPSCARYPLWVAGYQTSTPQAWEDWPVGPWLTPAMWQHSSSESVPGVGACDTNIAPDDLRARLGLSDAARPARPVPPTQKEPEVAKVAFPLQVQDGENRRLPVLAIGGGFGWTRASVTYASTGVEVRRAVVGPNERPIPGLAPEGVESGRVFEGRGYIDLEAGDEWLAIELATSPVGTLDLYVEASDASTP